MKRLANQDNKQVTIPSFYFTMGDRADLMCDSLYALTKKLKMLVKKEQRIMSKYKRHRPSRATEKRIAQARESLLKLSCLLLNSRTTPLGGKLSYIEGYGMSQPYSMFVSRNGHIMHIDLGSDAKLSRSQLKAIKRDFEKFLDGFVERKKSKSKLKKEAKLLAEHKAKTINKELDLIRSMNCLEIIKEADTFRKYFEKERSRLLNDVRKINRDRVIKWKYRKPFLSRKYGKLKASIDNFVQDFIPNIGTVYQPMGGSSSDFSFNGAMVGIKFVLGDGKVKVEGAAWAVESTVTTETSTGSTTLTPITTGDFDDAIKAVRGFLKGSGGVPIMSYREYIEWKMSLEKDKWKYDSGVEFDFIIDLTDDDPGGHGGDEESCEEKCKCECGADDCPEETPSGDYGFSTVYDPFSDSADGEDTDDSGGVDDSECEACKDACKAGDTPGEDGCWDCKTVAIYESCGEEAAAVYWHYMSSSSPAERNLWKSYCDGVGTHTTEMEMVRRYYEDHCIGLEGCWPFDIEWEPGIDCIEASRDDD